MKDLVLKSLDAHKKYIVARIECPKGRVFYEEMFTNIQTYVQAFDSYYLTVFVLEAAFSQLRESPFSLNRELKYKRLALEHASDVIVSLNKRFNNAKN